jgi:hypothetical protein
MGEFFRLLMDIFKKDEPKITHQHKCPDCGTIFTCPCGKSCKVEYDKYPCINCIMNHCVVLHSTIEGALKEK